VATIPGVLIPWLEARFTDANGAPLAGGKILSYEAGTTTPKPLYTSAALNTPHANPVVLDAAGRAKMYMAPGGYKFVVTDALDVQQYTLDNIEDVGQTWFNELGTLLAQGAAAVTSGYEILADDDQLVTVDSTGGPDPCVVVLPAAAERGLPICVKNLGTVVVDITPQTGETIDSVAGPYELPVAASPLFPSVWLVSDGVSGYVILASHGV
jgi:hypothetical protein